MDDETRAELTEIFMEIMDLTSILSSRIGELETKVKELEEKQCCSCGTE